MHPRERGNAKEETFSDEFKKKVQAAYNQLYEDRKHLLYDDSDEETCFAMDWYYEMKKFDEEYFGAQTKDAEGQSSGSASNDVTSKNDIKRIRQIAEEYAAVGSEERLLDENNIKELKEQLKEVRKDISELPKSLLGQIP